MDILSQNGDVCELLFSNRRAQHACRLFLEKVKRENGLTREEFQRFSCNLRDGKVESGFRYSRTRFYSQVRKTLLTLGLIAIEQRPVDPATEGDLLPERRRGYGHGGVVDKYVAVWQPIPKRPPDGLNLVRLTWIICEKWNREFYPWLIDLKKIGRD
jgi:hypothetical protein